LSPRGTAPSFETLVSELHLWTYSDLHDFNCPTDGCNPSYSGILAQGRDGSIYGTLPTGGSGGWGTVFKITPSGSLTVLHSFTGVADGGQPYGGLTLGTDGNLYGTTQPLLNGCYGTVFRISPNGGTPKTLHCFTASNGDGYYPYSPPVLGKKGENTYCARGEMENRIKEQLSLFADRMSTESLRANQLRLYFSSLAYVLIHALRRLGLAGTEWAQAQVHTIRLRLLKIAAEVRLSVRRIWVSFSNAYPWKNIFAAAWVALRC